MECHSQAADFAAVASLISSGLPSVAYFSHRPVQKGRLTFHLKQLQPGYRAVRQQRPQGLVENHRCPHIVLTDPVELAVPPCNLPFHRSTSTVAPRSRSQSICVTDIVLPDGRSSRLHMWLSRSC